MFKYKLKVKFSRVDLRIPFCFFFFSLIQLYRETFISVSLLSRHVEKRVEPPRVCTYYFYTYCGFYSQK
jgi:hypothetical protein